jgi:hypothetical protein
VIQPGRNIKATKLRQAAMLYRLGSPNRGVEEIQLVEGQLVNKPNPLRYNKRHAFSPSILLLLLEVFACEARQRKTFRS